MAFNPTLDPNSPLCAGIARTTVGALGNVTTTYLNNGRFQTSGLDFQLDWAKDIGPGRFTLNSVLNYVISMKSAELGVLPLVDYVGTTSPTQKRSRRRCFPLEAVRRRSATRVGPVSVMLQWRHLPRVLTETSATVPTTPICRRRRLLICSTSRVSDRSRRMRASAWVWTICSTRRRRCSV